MSTTYSFGPTLNSGATYSVIVGGGGSSCGGNGGTGGSATGGAGWGSILNTNSGAGHYTLSYPTYDTGISTPTLSVSSDAKFEGDVIIKGKSVTDRLDEIERRLCILQRDPGLEARWSELKALGEQYRELEKDIIEKEKIWDILKK